MPYIGTKDISYDHKINYENGVKITDYKNYLVAPIDSILLCIEGGSAGRKISITNKEVCFGNKLCCFYSKNISPLYIYYFLQSNEFKNVFKSNINGIIGGVGVNKLKRILIPIPPLNEQFRMIDKVSICFDLLDNILKCFN